MKLPRNRCDRNQGKCPEQANQGRRRYQQRRVLTPSRRAYHLRLDPTVETYVPQICQTLSRFPPAQLCPTHQVLVVVAGGCCFSCPFMESTLLLSLSFSFFESRESCERSRDGSTRKGRRENCHTREKKTLFSF